MPVTLTSIGNTGYTLTATRGAEDGVTLWFRPPARMVEAGVTQDLAILLTDDEARAFADELAGVLAEQR